jgi:hypothetical protein
VEFWPLLATPWTLATTYVFGGPASLFLGYAVACAAFVVVVRPLRRLSPAAEAWWQVAASVALIGVLTTPTLAALFVAYTGIFWCAVERLPAGHGRATVLIGLLVLHAVAPICLLPQLPAYGGRVREFVTFATNATLLRFWAYAYDRCMRPEPTAPSLRDVALYHLYFPTFVNGPLMTHTDFLRRRARAADAPTAPGARARHAGVRVLRGIAAGVFAIAALDLRGGAYVDATLRGEYATAWPLAARVYLVAYLGFWAWTEIAIGFGMLTGVDVPENFDRPHLAYGTADFWRRWNITFSHWLRSFIYMPLGGALVRDRRGRRVLEWRNTAAVFFFVAAYHLLGGLKLLGPGFMPWYSYVPWMIWFAMNTVAVLATRQWKRPARLGVRGALVVLTTLAFACVGHMTALFPPPHPVTDLLRVYLRLVWPA